MSVKLTMINLIRLFKNIWWKNYNYANAAEHSCLCILARYDIAVYNPCAKFTRRTWYSLRYARIFIFEMTAYFQSLITFFPETFDSIQSFYSGTAIIYIIYIGLISRTPAIANNAEHTFTYPSSYFSFLSV